MADDNVDFSAREGEVHALVGENGAGKTTLMNILYGQVRPDKGTISVDGRKVQISHPNDAIRLGIGFVHQHFQLVPSFSVAENIMLGRESGAFGVLRAADEREHVRRLAEEFGLAVDPGARLRDLPVGMQQRVEILKALQRRARILILDEPTSVLTPQEARELFKVVRGLAGSGRTVIFITHKLLEVMEVADRVSVMRRGRMMDTADITETSVQKLARLMVGREVLLSTDRSPREPGRTVLETANLSVAGPDGLPAVLGVSLAVREREILGVAGVNGNGQTELIEAIAGLRPADLGRIRLMGAEVGRLSVRQRRGRGMAHIPEDRMLVGLNPQTTLDENLIVSRYRIPQFNRLGFLRRAEIRRFSMSTIERFSIAAARPGGRIASLSGGNLQKVVLGRELAGHPRLIIANQPTRGLDVGSIEAVHGALLAERDRGAAILLVSVELDEILALSDRVVVLFRGRIAGELAAADATAEKLGILMAGGSL
jgi:simple sugar transport system ATP-binding protein